MSLSTVVQRLELVLILHALYLASVNSQLYDSYGENNVKGNFVNHVPSSFGVNDTLAVINLIQELQPKNVIELEANQIFHNGRDSDNQTVCDVQFASFVSGLSKFELWALKLLDSSSKVPSGILMGNTKDLGVYDECVSVEIQKEIGLIRGRHCMYSLSLEANLPMPINLTLSICLPSACNAHHTSQMLRNAINKISGRHPFNVTLGNVVCSAVDAAPFETGEIVSIVILSVFFCLLLGCTLCDIVIRMTSLETHEGFLNGICKFSLYANVQRIFDTTVPRGNIPAIQGIRFFSLCWVVLGHEHIYPNTMTAMNLADVLPWMGSWSAIYILIAPFAVDTFFVLTGFLSSYLFIKEMKKGHTFNLIMYYIHRYIRLTPALAAMIVLTIYILPRMGSGPMWDSTMTTQKEMCKSNWWPMILYVHNHVGKNSMGCLGHTWYLAVDMQLFWISPLILYPLSKKPKIGLCILAALVIASIITPAVIAGENKYSLALITNAMDMSQISHMMKNFYVTAYTRAGPWILGIYLGYRLSGTKDKPSLNFMILGWILAVLALAFSFFIYRIFQSVDYKWNASWEIFYAGFGRHIWAFAICWLIYASVLGYGGAIAKFLSLPVFIPLGRLSYCIYLVHMVIQQMRTAAARIPSYFTELTIIYSFFGEFITSVIAGIVLSLVFESPFLVLEKMMVTRYNRVEERHESWGNQGDTETSVGVDNNGYNFGESEARIEKEKNGH